MEVTVISTDNIQENSTMTRGLCIELTNIREGLERSVYVDLEFTGEGFAVDSKSTMKVIIMHVN